MNEIKFYSTRGTYGPFSNFARFSIVMDGKCFPTTEHYYQSQKTLDEKEQERIRKLKTPREAADEGRKLEMRPDWESIKYQVMKTAVKAKFVQHNSLKQLLLSTEDATIIEDSPHDYTWGCGKDGTGTNWLGKVLMEVREELKDVRT